MGNTLRRAAAALAALLIAALLPGRGAEAQISPGELSRPHAALEGSDRCLQCHSPSRGVDRARCLECHTPLGDRIRAGRGLHARPDYQECQRCHIEHHGRGFELVWWGDAGEAAFDHSLTGFTPQGAHAPLACRSCHRADRIADPAPLEKAGIDLGRTFLGLAQDCASCHRDEHHGQFAGRGCATCHGETKWTPAVRFDHAQSSFPLTGRHRTVACASCHPAAAGATPATARYRGTATACAACHADPHQGRLGTTCATCHRTDDWKRIDRAGFDHGRTRFPLSGRHARVACAECHRPGQPMRIAGFERCATCHADPHAGQFRARAGGGECRECHGDAGFRPSLFTLADHQRTAYPLTGAHREVACADCHTAVPPAALEAAGVTLTAADRRSAAIERFRFASTACASCHRDPHAGDADRWLGDAGCATCHAVASWQEVSFDHGRTGFDLRGAHRPLACVACHRPREAGAGAETAATAPRQVRLAGAPRDCAGCHRDPHVGQLERIGDDRSCARCHGERDWQPSRFDHDRDAAFKLEGAHRAVACVGCHPLETAGGETFVRYRPLGRACIDCHLPGPIPRAAG